MPRIPRNDQHNAFPYTALNLEWAWGQLSILPGSWQIFAIIGTMDMVFGEVDL